MRLTQKMAGIEEFIRTAETRSFVRAAESLQLTPSAVSKAIRLLESRVGVRLLHRTTRSVSMTDDGQTFYLHVVKWLADFEDLHNQLSGGEGHLQGIVRIDMPVTYGRVLFLPCLARFLERHPKVHVDVRLNDYYVDLVAEGVDLAIRIGDLPDSELVALPLGKIKFGTYMSVACKQRYGAPEQPEALLSHRVISFVNATGRAQKLHYVKQGQIVTIDPRSTPVSFNNGEAITDAVIAGLGIAQLPTFHAEQALRAGLITQVLTGLDAEGPAIQLVYASRKHL
ncbi:MAG: LysR substrate-binding domain-containing protein, partial [Enterobacteriaceae bacterium]